jgi:hypothetical protein
LVAPFHIADGGLPTATYMNMLHANVLLLGMTQASKNLYLHCKRSQ